MTYQARIRNAFVVAGRLVGEVLDHPRQAEFINKQQMTSRIVSGTPYEDDIIETFSGGVYTVESWKNPPRAK